MLPSKGGQRCLKEHVSVAVMYVVFLCYIIIAIDYVYGSQSITGSVCQS